MLINLMLLSSFLILLLCFALFKKNMKYRDLFLLLLISVCALTYYAYHTEAIYGDDLYTYFYEMDRYRARNLSQVFAEGMWRNTPVSTMLLYAFSLTGDNHLLPAFNICIIWSIYLFILLDSTKVGKTVSARKFTILLFILVFVNNIYGNISGVRSPLATAIACLGLYLDYQKNRTKSAFGLYILASLIHVNCINIILIRLISMVSIRKKSYKTLILLLVCYVLGAKILSNSSIPFLRHLFEKLDMYSGLASTGIRWFISKIVLFLALLLLCIGCVFEADQTKFSVHKVFCVTLCTYMLVMLFFFQYIPMRLQTLVYMITVPLLTNSNRNTVIFKIGILFLLAWMVIDLSYEVELYSHWHFVM